MKQITKIAAILLYAGSLLYLTSCAKEDSSDVNQDKIWTEYELFYNKNDDKTHAVARFRFGGSTGTLLELSDTSGAQVTFNGSVMPYNAWWGAHHLEFAGKLTSGTFSYKNTNGTVYTNAVPAGADTIAYPVGFDTIVKSQSETFTWIGNPLAPDQSVGIFVGSWAWANDALFYTEDDNATNMIFGVQAKNSLSLGQATVYMDRTVRKNTINGTSKGGTIRYTYRPLNVNVSVVP